MGDKMPPTKDKVELSVCWEITKNEICPITIRIVHETSMREW